MAQATSSSQSELDDVLDDVASVKSILDEAYDPEASREDLAKAVGEALDVLEDYDGEGEEDDDYVED